jgi:hypothetical protein
MKLAWRKVFRNSLGSRVGDDQQYQLGVVPLAALSAEIERRFSQYG